MDEQGRRYPKYRDSTTSASSTIADYQFIDEEVPYNEKRSSYKDDNNEKSFQFSYTENVADISIHPHDTLDGNPGHQTRGQDHITILENTPPRNNTDSPRPEETNNLSFWHKLKHTTCVTWVKKQCRNTDNRYALQMSVAFTIAAVLVMVDPISSVFPNTFWIGVSVVTVLDTTVGGFLSLSIQRFLGTIVGGAASIVVMTVTRAMFHPNWEWPAAVVLGCFMFIQIFFISKLKMRPNMAYSGSIGLLTTCIILLSGYPDLIHDRLSLAAELGAWRALDLIIGIFISLIVSLCVFPVKSSSMLRQNLGKSIEETADLYAKSSAYYVDFSCDPSTAMQETMARQLPDDDLQQSSFSNILSRMFSTQPPGSSINPEPHTTTTQTRRNQVSQFWAHDTVTNISNEAFGVLAKLQTESTRLRNVASESSLQIPFHFFEGGKERCKRDLRRAKRYNEAIEAMKRVVWPLVSFRLLLPLISLSHVHQRSANPDALPDIDTLQQRIKPTRETQRCFQDSLKVMRRLGAILKDHTNPLSAFPSDWQEIERMVNEGNLLIQRELERTVRLSMYGDDTDGLRLLSYYGFVVRCSMIWDGLKTVVEKLTPLKGTLSRASSMGMSSPLPNREIIHAPE